MFSRRKQDLSNHIMYKKTNISSQKLYYSSEEEKRIRNILYYVNNTLSFGACVNRARLFASNFVRVKRSGKKCWDAFHHFSP